MSRAATYTLGYTNLYELPAAGVDSVLLGVSPGSATWAATTNASWLHLAPANLNGTGNATVIFSFDANLGNTRTGLVMIAGQTLAVVQAGVNYALLQPTMYLATVTNSSATQMAVDGNGNIFYSDYQNNSVQELAQGSAIAYPAYTETQSSGQITGVAVGPGNQVYFTEYQSGVIDGIIRTISSGIIYPAGSPSVFPAPTGIAVDSATNVYISDGSLGKIIEWVPSTGAISNLFSAAEAYDTAVDPAGNVYGLDFRNGISFIWNPSTRGANTMMSGLTSPTSIAADGSGNVYVTEGNVDIKKRTAATGTVSTFASPGGINGNTVDAFGNVYYFVNGGGFVNLVTLFEVPRILINTTPRPESVAGGSDSLVLFPPSVSFKPPFAGPVSDQSWLQITGTNNGIVRFTVSANLSTSPRTAHINLLGQSVPVIQQGVIYTLGAVARFEGPAAGSDSVIVAPNLPSASWTVSANNSWLHFSSANQSGSGSKPVVFSYDSNTARAPRTGTFNLAGQTVSVTQAGSNYVQATGTVQLASNPYQPEGLAVGTNGNVFFADQDNNQILEWLAASNTTATVVANSLHSPFALALDGFGNVYVPDTTVHEIFEYTNGALVPLITNGLDPQGLTVDTSGNIYIANGSSNNILKWTPGTQTVTTLISSNAVTPLNGPYSIAVDIAGNLYIADYIGRQVKEWNAQTGSLTTLVTENNFGPSGVAVDGAGNVFVADPYNATIQEISAASNTVLTIYQPLSTPSVAVDGTGNLYLENAGLQEAPRAFVDLSPLAEPAGAGTDSLPVVVPATQNLLPPFYPVSSQPWLAITGVSGGVVTFAFTANPAATNRTAKITLLGQTIPVSQVGAVLPFALFDVQQLANGHFQFQFTNANATASYTILSASNLSTPLTGWTVVGAATNISANLFEFTDTNQDFGPRYYIVRSP